MCLSKGNKGIGLIKIKHWVNIWFSFYVTLNSLCWCVEVYFQSCSIAVRRIEERKICFGSLLGEEGEARVEHLMSQIDFLLRLITQKIDFFGSSIEYLAFTAFIGLQQLLGVDRSLNLIVLYIMHTISNEILDTATERVCKIESNSRTYKLYSQVSFFLHLEKHYNRNLPHLGVISLDCFWVNASCNLEENTGSILKYDNV